ncbi:MAG: DUF222 domain-containing protein [Acidimicrobiia bacterium]
MHVDPMAQISEGRERLQAEDRSSWANAALSDRMLALAAECERMGAELVRLTGLWDPRGAWGDDGYASASSWLTANARQARGAAGRLLRSARHVQRFTSTGDALAAGTVTADKVEVLAEAARHREEFYERDEEVLLDAASRLDVRDLTTAVRTWRMLADDDAAADDTYDAHERVHLHVSPTLLGGELSGFLDPEGTTLLADALDLLEPPDPALGPDAPRTLSQRRGEGLVKLARFYLNTRSGGGAGGHAVPTVSVVFTPDHDPWLLEDHRCEIEGFGAVCFDTVSRLVCDARTAWLTVNGEREVLDMGRESRTVTPGQRRAVVVRDRHCRYPGCRAPASWCDTHHLVPWEHGGPTDLDNLVLLCRRHHVVVHEGGRRLVRDLDGSFRVEQRPARPPRRRFSRRAAPRGDPDGDDG